MPYASCFAAMVMGRWLLEDLGRPLRELDYRTFEQARRLVVTHGEAYFERAMRSIEQALDQLYGGQPLSLQRLAATFRRGDLIAYLL